MTRWVVGLACLLVLGSGPAAAAPSSPLQRLADAVVTVIGRPIDGVYIGPTPPASVRVDCVTCTGGQLTQIQAVVNAFDYSAGAQTAFENLKARAAAKALMATIEATGKRDRCFADLVRSEVNILRAIPVGTGSVVWDPASIANGAGLNSPSVTVTGAAFGDDVRVMAPYSLQGLTATASLVSANTITARLENQTGAAVNLASGTWTFVVLRWAVMAPRTNPQLRTAIDACIDAGGQD